MRNVVKLLFLLSLLSVAAFAQGGNPLVAGVNWLQVQVNSVVDGVCGLIILYAVFSGMLSVRAGLSTFALACVVVYFATHNMGIVSALRGI